MRFLRLALGCLAAALLLGAQPDPPLEVRFLDVGQADAILIQLGRKAVLVDAGRADDIVQVLAEYEIDSLDAVIASHNHDDHIGGMGAVISDYSIGRYYSNGRPAGNANTRRADEWLARRGVSRPAPPWEPITLGDVRITVLPSLLADASENNSSLGVLIERGAFRALLTGDSESEELNAWLATGVIPDVDVLKAAHHGAKNGVTPGWLDRTKPEVVIISLGANNSYGHPDPWAMRYYQSHRRAIYRTDLHGTVTVSVDREGRYRVDTAGPTVR